MMNWEGLCEERFGMIRRGVENESEREVWRRGSDTSTTLVLHFAFNFSSLSILTSLGQ